MRYAALPLLLFSLVSVALAGGRDLTVPTVGAAAYPHFGPAVATNGSSFVTVWSMDAGAGGFHVFASVADGQGKTMSSGAVHLLSGNSIYSVQVISFGDNYLLSWTDERDLSSHAAEITPALQIVRSFILPARGRLAWNGTNLLLVAPSPRYRGYLLNRDGTIVRDDVQVLGAGSQFDVAAAGADFVVLTWGQSGVTVARLSPVGAPRAPQMVTVDSASTNLNEPRPTSAAIASLGNEVVVAWTRSVYGDNFAPQELWTAAIQPDGAITRTKLPTGSEAGTDRVILAPNGNSYLLFALIGRKNPYGRPYPASQVVFRLDRTASPIDNQPQLITDIDSRFITAVAVANAVAYAAILQSPLANLGRSFHRVIAYSFPVEQATNQSPEEVLSILPRRQSTQAIATDGVGYLGVWTEQTTERDYVSAGRIASNGTPLDTTSVELTLSGGTTGGHDVAFGGSTYLVIWVDKFTLFARRITELGVILDPTPITISNKVEPSGVVAIWNSRDFLVAWSQAGRIYGTFVGTDGNFAPVHVLSAETPSFSGGVPAVHRDPDVAWDGSHYLLVWNSTAPTGIICTCPPPPIDLYAGILAGDANPLGSAMIVESNAKRIRVASSGSDFLALEETYTGISVRMMSANGAALRIEPPRSIFEWPFGVESEVSFDGNDYIIAWRYGIWTLSPWRLGTTWIASDGAAFDRRMAETLLPEIGPPSIAAKNPAETLVALSEIPSSIGTARIRGYFVSEMAPMPERPAPPANVTAINTPAGVIVSWSSPPSNVDGYVFEASYSWSPGTFTRTGVITKPVTTSTLQSNQMVAVRVLAYGAGGTSDPSPIVRVLDVSRRRAARP
jgi:hypothetical protein